MGRSMILRCSCNSELAITRAVFRARDTRMVEKRWVERICVRVVCTVIVRVQYRSLPTSATSDGRVEKVGEREMA